MFNLFGFGRQTTDDTEEKLIREWAGTERQNSHDLQVRMRHSHTMELEEDIHRTHRKVRSLSKENVALQRELTSKRAEIEQLHSYIDALRETAIKIAVDRRAIFNTLEHYNEAWGINSPKSAEAAELTAGGRLVLFDEAERRREEERALLEDESRLTELAARLDEVVASRLAVQSPSD